MTITSSQEAFLQAFHAERPAVTAEAFGRGRAPDGRSSYELLCDRVAGSGRVLDLGCGDGLLLEFLARGDGRQLAGVDLSPQSLALARRRPALSETRLDLDGMMRLELQIHRPGRPVTTYDLIARVPDAPDTGPFDIDWSGIPLDEPLESPLPPGRLLRMDDRACFYGSTETGAVSR
ncbi:class I SAM-dependent methyltransferase [Streptomyces sp. MK37H]|uniref:SAM-dependent methyltransferase n=1 Tax=Streptomyces sp. MK37H TaxID=2699117 RepID=UPI0027E52C12|nr:class I SAM-dependent methyltransferase [Streptomyces sp. MK37H]